MSILSKIGDIFRGPHRVFAGFVVLCVFIFLVLWIVGPGNTIGHWIRAKIDDKAQQEEIRLYEQKNSELDRQIEMMTSNRDSLEKFAREQYYLAKPDEDVYIIE